MINSNSSETNILEAYITKHNQCIILILGLPCTSKSKLAKELSIDLKLPKININDYLINSKYIEKEIDGVKFKIYEDEQNFDWDKLNDVVNNKKKTGVILYGNIISKNKLDFNIDFSFFINMNYNLCKKMLIEKKLIDYKPNSKQLNIYFTKIFNPLYDELKTNIKIIKFFNIKEKTIFDDIYDDLFDILMNMINLALKK